MYNGNQSMNSGNGNYRTTYMAASDWFTVERQDFVVLRRGRIWRPKQNAWLNGKNSLHVTYKHFRS